MSSCEWCDELGMSINPGPVIKTDILQPPKKMETCTYLFENK